MNLTEDELLMMTGHIIEYLTKLRELLILPQPPSKVMYAQGLYQDEINRNEVLLDKLNKELHK